MNGELETSSGVSRDARAELDALLNELLQHPYQREEIERRIEDLFACECAVMVLDLAGFSRATNERGIVASLLMTHQMRLLTVPIIEQSGGEVIEATADDLLCVFGGVPEAVASGREVIRALDTANVLLASDLELYVSIGIGWGRILRIGNDRVAGAPVNLAGKLGEDVAASREILLTAEARAMLGDAALEERRTAVSGMELSYYALPN